VIGKPEGKILPKDLDVGGSTILDPISEKSGGNFWAGSFDSGWGPTAEFCEHGFELSGSIKG
jgi:hypothetical protein